jgi:hypothetical protein
MNIKTATARITGIKEDKKLHTILTTPLLGMVPVIEAAGFKFIGFNRSEYGRTELQGIPKFSGLCGPMWGDGQICYETWRAYEDISSDIS